MPKLERARGLYQNGSRWWVRTVSAPQTSRSASLSTGTDDLRTANRVAAMLDSLQENRLNWDLLELLLDREVSLLELYNAYSVGALSSVREERQRKLDAEKTDPDVEPWVGKWYKEHLTARVVGGEIGQRSADEYLRQLRAFVPDAEYFPASKFGEDFIKERLSTLVDPNRGTTLSPSTRRRYLAALQLFYRYARKRVPLTVNPFEERDWFPANGSPRSTYWDYDTAVDVLERMTGEPRLFMELVFGSGIELGAALAMKVGDVTRTGEDHVVRARGSKNEHREDRLVFVTDRAYKQLMLHIRNRLPAAPLWETLNPANRGREIREAFYEAQVAAGVIEAPPVNKKTGKKLWAAVNPHRIHDARHSYCYIRMLGLDGERRFSTKECSQQLGHADEQMVMKVYNKANIAQRLRLIELAEARQAGRDEGK